MHSLYFRVGDDGQTRVASSLTGLILQAEKFLKCDWLRPVVFHPNLKYLHVKITVSMVTEMILFENLKQCGKISRL